MGTQLENLSKVKPIALDHLAEFATEQHQSDVSDFNASVGVHNDAIAAWESDYSTAVSGAIDPSTVATTASSLAASRLSLASEAVTLAAAKPALWASIRGDWTAASQAIKNAAPFGIQSLNEAVGDEAELDQVKIGLGAAMQAAI